jgi:hypothetical protein
LYKQVVENNKKKKAEGGGGGVPKFDSGVGTTMILKNIIYFVGKTVSS